MSSHLRAMRRLRRAYTDNMTVRRRRLIKLVYVALSVLDNREAAAPAAAEVVGDQTEKQRVRLTRDAK